MAGPGASDIAGGATTEIGSQFPLPINRMKQKASFAR
jgi:hypothetical protein